MTVLATFEDHRNSSFPDALTFREVGYDVVMGVYYPVLAPKNMPADVKAKLFKAAKAAIESPAFSGPAKDRGYILEVKDPELFRKEIWGDYRANLLLLTELGMGKK